jgi:AraC-like DNA-binding protein
MDNNQENVQEVLNRLLNLILKLPLRTNIFQTEIPFLQILTEKSPTVASKGPLKPSLCIIVQGKTHMQIGEDIIEYKPGNFLASSVSMPVTGQVVEASAAAPYMAVRIELPPGEVAVVATEADLKHQLKSKQHHGIFVGKTTLEILEGFEKLLKLLQNPKAANYLAPSVKREIIYWLLTGEEGADFYFSMLWHQEASQISKVVDWVTHNFNSTINIKGLAKLGNMSVSSLHYKFKEVTGKTPLQYQKQLRLQESRRLLLDGANVTETALQMGYQSSTQFSREYKRLFGLSPVHYLRSRNDAHSNQI